MKITNPLDNILNNETKVKILRFLLKTDAQWNGRQIAKEIGASPTTTHKALHELQKEGVLSLHNIGRTHVYNLNKSSMIVMDMLKPLFAKEDKILDGILTMVKRRISSSKAKKDIVSVALFGSVKTRKDHPASDIDLAIIVENAKAKSIVERLFDEIDAKISKEFGNTISPYINTRIEFKSKYDEGVPVIKNILKFHKVIYGERVENLL